MVQGLDKLKSNTLWYRLWQIRNLVYWPKKKSDEKDIYGNKIDCGLKRVWHRYVSWEWDIILLDLQFKYPIPKN